ncbi:MAG TPA: hypothetical protein VGK99_03820 [Acidobacteriota bacterium]|jgi:hypothetical protein
MLLAALILWLATKTARPVQRQQQTSISTVSAGRMSRLPKLFLWAWERPEDLRFIDPHRVGVAYLAQTLHLRGKEMGIRPRLQPLHVPPDTVLIAVTRIEADRTFALSTDNGRVEAIASAIQKSIGSAAAVQLDFDARNSERTFYLQIIDALRRQMPDSVGLSITALASWCLFDRWLSDVPVDEIVPMMFRMGPEAFQIRTDIASGQDFQEPDCCGSVGIATDEPFPTRTAVRRRVYAFNPRPWSRRDFENLLLGVNR